MSNGWNYVYLHIFMTCFKTMSKLQRLTRFIMSCNTPQILSYGVSICFVLLIKQKYARILCTQPSHALCCGKNVCSQLVCLDCIFSVLVAKTKNMHFDVSYVINISVQKLAFLCAIFCVTIMLFFFTYYYIK